MLSFWAPTSLAAQTDLDELVERVNHSLQQIQDISFHVELTRPLDGMLLSGTAQVAALPPHLFRISYLRPEIYQGTIIVVDQAKDEVQWYLPITEQVVHMSIDRFLAQHALPVQAEQLFQLPSPEDYILRTHEADPAAASMVVSARSRHDPSEAEFHFRIDLDQYLITGMTMFNSEGVVEIALDATSFRLNQGLTQAQLLRMPAGADRIYR